MYSVQCTWYKSQLRLYGGATPYEGSRSSDSDLSRSEGLDHAERASTGFIFASGGVPSEGYGHGGSDVCLGDGHTEAEGVPSQGGRGDAFCLQS